MFASSCAGTAPFLFSPGITLVNVNTADAVGPVRVKRVYEAADPDDGRRILVDRIWPRGIKKDTLEFDAWIRGVAPSTSLRQWFGHEPAKWGEFKRRYRDELNSNPAVDELRDLLAVGPVTLLYSARDTEHNQAVALAEYLSGDRS